MQPIESGTEAWVLSSTGSAPLGKMAGGLEGTGLLDSGAGMSKASALLSSRLHQGEAFRIDMRCVPCSDLPYLFCAAPVGRC